MWNIVRSTLALAFRLITGKSSCKRRTARSVTCPGWMVGGGRGGWPKTWLGGGLPQSWLGVPWSGLWHPQNGHGNRDWGTPRRDLGPETGVPPRTDLRPETEVPPLPERTYFGPVDGDPFPVNRQDKLKILPSHCTSYAGGN